MHVVRRKSLGNQVETMEKNQQERSAGEAPVVVAPKRKMTLYALLSLPLPALYLLCCVLAATCTTIFPGVNVEKVALSGLSQEAAAQELAERSEELFAERRFPVLLGKEIVCEVTTTEAHAVFDPEATARDAFAVGRQGNFFSNGWTYLRCLLGGGKMTPRAAASEEDLLACAEDVALRQNRAPVDGGYRIAGGQLYLCRPRDGEEIDVAALTKALGAALSSGDMSGIVCTSTARTGAPLDLAAVAQELANGSNATFDRSTGTVTEARLGASFDIAEAEKLLADTAPGEEVCVPATVFEPTVSRAEMSAVLFRDQMGTYSTYVGGSAARIENVRRAAEEINDYVLNAGETFSFNMALGEITESTGYAAAPLNPGDPSGAVLGGGVSQCASTLYYACVLANLTVVQRANQTYAPAYITLGCDAVAADGTGDFQFQNNTDYPVRVVAELEGNNLTVTLYGSNLTGQSVRLISHTVSSTPYETTYEETADLPFGQTREMDSPYIGYNVKTYRNVYDAAGELIASTLEAESSYQVRNRRVLTGTAMSAPSAEEAPTPAPQSPS
jgi:vancomycin resistance protein YoaR